MPQENVEILRHGLDAFNRRDKAAFIALCDSGCENFPPEGMAGERTDPRCGSDLGLLRRHSGLQTQYRVYPGFGPLSARLAMYLI